MCVHEAARHGQVEALGVLLSKTRGWSLRNEPSCFRGAYNGATLDAVRCLLLQHGVPPPGCEAPLVPNDSARLARATLHNAVSAGPQSQALLLRALLRAPCDDEPLGLALAAHVTDEHVRWAVTYGNVAALDVLLDTLSSRGRAYAWQWDDVRVAVCSHEPAAYRRVRDAFLAAHGADEVARLASFATLSACASGAVRVLDAVLQDAATRGAPPPDVSYTMAAVGCCVAAQRLPLLLTLAAHGCDVRSLHAVLRQYLPDAASRTRFDALL